MSLFGLIADVVLAPVRVATVAVDRTVRATGKAVVGDLDGVCAEVEKGLVESVKVVEKIADEVE